MHSQSHCFCSCFLPRYQGHTQPGGSGGLLEIPAKLLLPSLSLSTAVIHSKGLMFDPAQSLCGVLVVLQAAQPSCLHLL